MDDDNKPKDEDKELENKPVDSDGDSSNKTDPDSDKSPDESSSASNNNDVEQASADALSKTPDELEEEAKETGKTPVESEEKQLSSARRVWRKINIYLLLFILVCLIAAVIVAVTYLNSQKEPVVPSIATQELTQDALKQLSNTNVSIGDNTQTLTVKGNADITGQTLMRGKLSVAGDLQVAGSITTPNLTVSTKANLADTQVSSLQVAQNLTIQGDIAVRNINVSGTSSFGGPLTASKIIVRELEFSGNGVLTVPNHIQIKGASPSRSAPSNLGSGGTASIEGYDTSGSISLRTGIGPVAGCYTRVTFSKPYAKTPRIIVSPVNAAAGKLSYYITKDTNGFSICSNSAPDASATFGFDYFVVY